MSSTIIPVFRYRDAPAAIEWLCQAFGFEKHLVVPNDDGTIAHAQLNFGNGMIMLGSVRKNETEFGSLTKRPMRLEAVQRSPHMSWWWMPTLRTPEPRLAEPG